MSRFLSFLLVSSLASACGGEAKVWECQLEAGADPDFAAQLGCAADFEELASEPPSASIPGARAVKTIVDRLDENTLYFQNSVRYPIHWDFARAHLSGNGLPVVPELSDFNETEYYSPDRRFILGSLTHYEGPDAWVYEISPYDNASAELIELAFVAIRQNAFVGDNLYFHPTSDTVEVAAAELPDSVPIITTDELFEGIDYQPLNLGESYGQLRFVAAADLGTTYVGFRDIVVLDEVPNDISVTAGIITQTFQTPLSHINVLSQNRGTPNMGLREAFQHETLRPLEGKWVKLVVGAFEWSIEEVTMAEADVWWEEHKPEPIDIGDMDLGVTDLRDAEDMLDLTTYPALRDAISAVIPAFGGKASHFGGLSLIEADIGCPEGFAIPVYYYHQFMEQNGFWTTVDMMLEDPSFLDDPAVRDQRLAELREMMMAAPIDEAFLTLLQDKLAAKYPDAPPTRFRSSTNAEDLGDFTGAGLYTSQTADPDDPLDPIDAAIKEVWSSVWYFRAFEERDYHSIDHTRVGMALLVHPSFPMEESNGVALTANIFDTTGLEPGFYVNVQVGENSVVQPDPAITTDQYIHYYQQPGQPIEFLKHSNLVPEGQSVLTRTQMLELGAGMQAVHDYFRPAYGTGTGFYGMDIEFKFDDDGAGGVQHLVIKQARPHPGWGL